MELITLKAQTRENTKKKSACRAVRAAGDVPGVVYGGDTGPTPMEMVAGALAGCISITLRMVAQRKGWPLEGVDAEVAIVKETVEGSRPRDTFEVQVTLQGPLDDKMRAELTRIASRCPVHRVLAHETPVTTTVH